MKKEIRQKGEQAQEGKNLSNLGATAQRRAQDNLGKGRNGRMKEFSDIESKLMLPNVGWECEQWEMG